MKTDAEVFPAPAQAEMPLTHRAQREASLTSGHLPFLYSSLFQPLHHKAGRIQTQQTKSPNTHDSLGIYPEGKFWPSTVEEEVSAKI